MTWTANWQSRSPQLTDRSIKCVVPFHSQCSLLSVSSCKQEITISSILMSFVRQRYSIKFNCFPNGRFVTSTSQFQRGVEVKEKNRLQWDAILYCALSVLCMDSRPVQAGVPCQTESCAMYFRFGEFVFESACVRACAFMYVSYDICTYTYIIWGLKIWSTSLLFGIIEVH